MFWLLIVSRSLIWGLSPESWRDSRRSSDWRKCRWVCGGAGCAESTWIKNRNNLQVRRVLMSVQVCVLTASVSQSWSGWFLLLLLTLSSHSHTRLADLTADVGGWRLQAVSNKRAMLSFWTDGGTLKLWILRREGLFRPKRMCQTSNHAVVPSFPDEKLLILAPWMGLHRPHVAKS